MASKGHGKPNTSMVGNVGDLYEDLDTGMVYRLASIVLKEKQMGFVTIPEYVCETNQYIWAPVADVGPLSVYLDRTKVERFPGSYDTPWEEIEAAAKTRGVIVVLDRGEQEVCDENGTMVMKPDGTPLTYRSVWNYANCNLRWNDGEEEPVLYFDDEMGEIRPSGWTIEENG